MNLPLSMLYLRRLTLFSASLALLLLAPALAHATTGSTIVLGGLWDSLSPFISAAAEGAIVAIVGWLATRVNRWTGLNIEARHREALHSAAVTGIDLALSRIGGRADKVDINLKSELVAEAADWVARSVPDALAYLGVTPDKISDLVESKLRDAGVGR